MLVIDTEIFNNYFLLCMKNFETKEIIIYEIKGKNKTFENVDCKEMLNYFAKNNLISFNGIGFDMPIIIAALKQYKVKELKKIANHIIKEKIPVWKVIKNYELYTPNNWKHVDLMNVAPGISSLKMYGAKINSKTLKDFPDDKFEDVDINDDHILEDIIHYCLNDLQITHDLFETLKPSLRLRQTLSKTFNIDVMSRSNPQMGEDIITKIFLDTKKLKKYDLYKMKKEYGSFKCKDCKKIKFKSQKLKNMYNKIMWTNFEPKEGNIKLPGWMITTKIYINDKLYKLGIGGLHSKEKSQYIRTSNKIKLCDIDVKSYYPTLILNEKLYPPTLGESFSKIYEHLLEIRLKSKKEGNYLLSDGLKDALNGVFGKLGNSYSTVYAPHLLIQTTITGQLSLLMLIEQLEDSGIEVVSANTDGLVVKYESEKELNNVMFRWELQTGFSLEKNNYELIASRDVNNYVALKENNEMKCRGVFAPPSLKKNPILYVSYYAASRYICFGENIEQNIYRNKNIADFCITRKVTGGAIYLNEYLGKTVRFLYVKNVSSDTHIKYMKSGNKVPMSDGSWPMMTLDSNMFAHVDYPRYIELAKEIVRSTGVNCE